jgi:hypothetical protein
MPALTVSSRKRTRRGPTVAEVVGIVWLGVLFAFFGFIVWVAVWDARQRKGVE